jgi:hypothetical protein
LGNRNPTRQRGTKQDQIFLADALGYEEKRNFKTNASGFDQINKPVIVRSPMLGTVMQF